MLSSLYTIVVISSLWVYFDARRIGVRKGQVTGLANMNPIMWLLGCLLLWFITFPLYISRRPEFKRINGKDGGNLVANVVGSLFYLGVMATVVLSYAGLIRMSTPDLEAAVQDSVTQKFASVETLAGVEVKAVRLKEEGDNLYRGTVEVVSDGNEEELPIEVNYDGNDIRWQVKQ